MSDNRAAATKPSDSPTNNPKLLAWVDEMAKLTQPDQIVWCDGSEEEKQRLTKYAVDKGILIPLSPEKRPGCYLHRSDPNDVARTEHLTFVCTRTKDAAGPNNNWMDPKEGYAKLGKLFDALRNSVAKRQHIRHKHIRLTTVGRVSALFDEWSVRLAG